MAAYGSISSLLLTLDNILGPDDRQLPVSLDRRQLGSLQEKLRLLRQCLDRSSGNGGKVFGEMPQRKIRSSAARAADIIADSMYRHHLFLSPMLLHGLELLARFALIVCLLGFGFMPARTITLLGSVVITLNLIFLIMRLCPLVPIFIKNWANILLRNGIEGQVLSEILEEIDLIVEEVNEIIGVEGEDWQTLSRDTVYVASSLSSRGCKNAVVGMDSDLEEIVTRLVYGSPKLEVVPIVGMGGIGKTTLAKRVYDNGCANDHFDVCAWVTVSQEHQLLRLLLDLLDSAKRLTKEMKEENDEGKLSDYLYKTLKNRRYLIVMDDVWDVEVWDDVRRYFPDEDNNGSRVLLTTRLSEVANYANSSSPPHRMHLLDEQESWGLLCGLVFRGEDCPNGLREIGDEIVRNCKGLPLAIVVIGGLLSKTDRTTEDWRSFADSLRSAAVECNDECIEILALSYNHLPHHLRPCFLYIGMFPEDYVIPVTKLMWLWAAEGFLQPDNSKSPEELAEEYLQDLIERSLILVYHRNSQGKIKMCKIHDMLRQLCLHQARNERFIYVANNHRDFSKGAGEPCCILGIHPNVLKAYPNILYDKELRNSSAHSLLCIGTNLTSPQRGYLRCRLLRVLDLLTIHFHMFPLEIPNLVCLRYLALTFKGTLHPYISQLPNLLTFIGRGMSSDKGSFLPSEIWMLPNLRHLDISRSCLSVPPSGSNTFVIQSLQTLAEISNLTFGIEILNRLRNLKLLSVSYEVQLKSFRGWSDHKLENLVHLDQLEKLTFWVIDYGILSRVPHPPNLALPRSLKSLTLGGCIIPWEHLTHIGMLPNLEVLRLKYNTCRGEEWEPVEGQFCKLKSLLLQRMEDLVQWTADDTHFPRLQCLVVDSCHRLQEIPPGIGDIPTLEMIELLDCPHPVVASAERIREELCDMGDSDLNLQVRYTDLDELGM